MELMACFFFLIYLCITQKITDIKKEVTTEIIKRLDDTLDAVCKYLAEDNFKVMQTINTKFEYGDLVHVPFIRVGEPLSGWDIMRNNKIIGQYNSAQSHLINEKRTISLKKDN